jgi:serine O-acetyltransferase
MLRAIRIDARRAAAMRGEPHEFGSAWAAWMNVLRLLWASDDFAGVALYRVRTWLMDAHIPLIPHLASRVSAVLWGIRIGDRAVILEGLYLPHGTIVVDGVTFVGRNATIAPYVTIGLRQGDFLGPRIGDNVFIGTHASVIGDIHVGAGATVAAGAVVVDDVVDGATVAGVPARPVETRR